MTRSTAKRHSVVTLWWLHGRNIIYNGKFIGKCTTSFFGLVPIEYLQRFFNYVISGDAPGACIYVSYNDSQCKVIILNTFAFIFTWSRDSPVDITTSYGLGWPGLYSGAEARDFSLLKASRPALGPTKRPIFCYYYYFLFYFKCVFTRWHMMGIWDCFSRVKGPGREAGQSPPFSAVIKNGWAIPPLSHTSSWHGA
jgi:hypothetical protein